MKQKLLFGITAAGILFYLSAYPFISSGVLTGLQVSIAGLFLYLSWDLRTDANRNSTLYIGSLIIGGSFILIPMTVYEQNRSTTEQIIWTTLVLAIIAYDITKEYKRASK